MSERRERQRVVRDTISAEEARRMTLRAQGLTRVPASRVTATSIRNTVSRMGVLQIDSVNVFSRSHYLPLFSRLGAHSQELADQVLMGPKPDFLEYLAHEATFIPIADWPLWEFRRQRMREKWNNPDSWWSNNTQTLDWVRAELRERGGVRPADIREDRPRERGGWWDWDDTKTALEHLWYVGEVTVVGRRGFERVYSLAEATIAPSTLANPIPREDAITELVRRAARSYGVATASDLADYYRIKDRAAILRAVARLVDEGELIPTRVRTWDRGGKPIPTWRHRDAVTPRTTHRATILTPFDPVVWFRDRALRAFGLDYRIEIYTPAAKRQYGYYSLPVLVGDRIPARVDLKADRQNGTLLVQSAWWEPSAKPSDVGALAQAIVDAAEWRGLSLITVSRWGDASQQLADALQAVRQQVTTRHDHPRAPADAS